MSHTKTFALITFFIGCFAIQAKAPDFVAPKEQPDMVRFAIIADLTGGERPGVFNVAAEGIARLQPDFIMSIGDLIEGGTEDIAQMNKEWRTFKANLNNPDISFYPTVGNHDISNSVMRDWYESTIGPRYYHFVYKNALFIVIDSEDFSDEFFIELKQKRDKAIEAYKTNPDQFADTEYAKMPQRHYGKISKQQTDYVLKVLKQNTEVRWTFLFMHKPVWQDENESNFKLLEDAMKDRSYTVFNGHVHMYQHTHRFGMDYIQLATSGGKMFAGKSQNMDHITMVALSDDKPTYLNIKLDGMIDKTGKIPAKGDTLCFSASDCAKSK
ncbi:metallophosphoesterase [Thalassotalea sp. Y01]|uniref:metallophosphoesterase family protein n=1 Tax=Thalassotalea sp. Y01 TaxID=2729613 RepID=UPI00145D7A9D|nr:metallophosphoesterase [Thalassotalea sp. Y01]NMP15809.1 serine/threonine protein phosphatase [Thalassotalea sp. Y01]